MNVNTISGNASVISMQALQTSVSLEQSVGSVVASKDQSLKQANEQARVVTVNSATKVSFDKNQSPSALLDVSKKPERAIRNVVEVYNQQGKVRTKFMDSHNNVIYQIPSEMVAKMEDLMMKQETSTNIKG